MNDRIKKDFEVNLNNLKRTLKQPIFKNDVISINGSCFNAQLIKRVLKCCKTYSSYTCLIKNDELVLEIYFKKGSFAKFVFYSFDNHIVNEKFIRIVYV